MATIAACGGFAAVSGSSLATVATMAKVAIPSMRKYNYADSLAAGNVKEAAALFGSYLDAQSGGDNVEEQQLRNVKSSC